MKSLDSRERIVAAACTLALAAAFGAPAVAPLWARAAPGALPATLTLSTGWLMQDVAQVTDTADTISSPSFMPAVYVPKPYEPPPTAAANPADNPGANGTARPRHSSDWQQAPAPSSAAWYAATVPGTVLTTLVNNQVYPEPLYGENNRPNVIPESLCRTSYWYRTQVAVPKTFAGRRVWLNFDGINYMADVWVNGRRAGDIRGAFVRGNFDVTPFVTPGGVAAVAVLIKPPLIPADPLEQTQQWGMGPNGGVLSKDGPTFVSSQGWDWIPAIRDREMGIWQKVTLSASGPVVLLDPYVVTKLPLPRTDSADVSIEVSVKNVSDAPQSGTIAGTLGGAAFRSGPVTIGSGATHTMTFSAETTAALHLTNPQLWWPNGFGEPHLYPLHLSFEIDGTASDARDLNVGLRQITYQLGGRDDLALVVNGVPVFAKGGNWGMDEALKRIPRERLEAQMRLHREANYTIIRNWVGQSTSEDFYDLADRNGLMVWDEFFQPAAGLDSGRQRGDTGETDISDMALYLENARDKILRFRNHASIVMWCGRNEGAPSPKFLAGALQSLMAELDPVRYYHPDSDAGRGVRSGGPYAWQPPAAYYGEGRGGRGALVPFKSEIGSMSIPTIQAIRAMMPREDADRFPNDDWASHDFATGGGNNLSANYLTSIKARYGDVSTLERFVRAAQLMNYEAFRALYEGRLAKLFNPANAVITWMSNPAQPSMTWQIYSYDLEPFASFFAVKKACEPLHIQMNQNDFHVMVVNHRPGEALGLRYRVRIVDLDGKTRADATRDAGAIRGSAATDLGPIEFPAGLSAVHFVRVELLDARGVVVSDNFYWRNGEAGNDFTALDGLPEVALERTITRRQLPGRAVFDVTLINSSDHVALMAHVQLGSPRVLPVSYSDNYVSLLPHERRTITVEAWAKDLDWNRVAWQVDGWNIRQ